ncbi:MAG: glutamine amidotransferase [Myxococcota bacterium]
MEFWLGGALGEGGALIWTAPSWQIGLSISLAVIAWLAALLTGRGRGGLRVIELIAWALALVVLTVALCEPVWLEDSGRTEEGKVVVLIDRSASMDVREEGVSRSASVDGILSTVQGTVGTSVEVFSFSDDVQAGVPAAYDGQGTNIGVALAAVADRYLGQDLRGIVLISDGIDRGALRKDLAEVGEDVSAAVAIAPELPGPLTVYQVGSAERLHDEAITEVVTGGFAFLRTPFTLTARLRGTPGDTLPVTLSREGRLVDTRDVTLGEDGSGEVNFQVTPTAVGRFAWELAIPVDPADAVPGNNTYPVVIRVVRDRTRVLQVSGSPSYDQKFLRLFLKEDPSVDLVSFFILRTREDFGAGWNADELSLIAFPYQRLFNEELETFDLVVLQNFNYAPYFEYEAMALLENIASYVRDGGALVMTGGDRSFDLGRYGNTPISSILPVRLGVSNKMASEEPFQPQLTAAGRNHPITRIVLERDGDADAWDTLPNMDGFNFTGGLVPGSAVLLEHPTAREASGERVPILAVREVEEGRVMSLAVDASWRWSFSEAAEGRGNQVYLRFWKNALRWLVADPEDRRVVVVPSRENVLMGSEVRLTVKVRDAGYGPVEGKTAKGVVVMPDGTEAPFEVISGPTGEAATTFTPTMQGAHRVRVQTGAAAAERGETVFAVSARDPELLDIVPDGKFLSRLAEAYGPQGRFFGPGDDGQPLLNDGAERNVPEKREVALASAPLISLWFGLFASLAWWVRRRAGGR